MDADAPRSYGLEDGLAAQGTRTRTVRGVVHRIVYDDPRIDMSPLSQMVTRDGVTLVVRIYRFPQITLEWVLEVVDPEGGWTVWDTMFATDRAALRELFRVINAEGIRMFSEQADTVH